DFDRDRECSVVRVSVGTTAERAGGAGAEDAMGGAVAPVDIDGPGTVGAGVGEGAEAEALRRSFAGGLVGGGRDDRGHVVDGDRRDTDVAGAVLVRDGHGERVKAVVSVRMRASSERAGVRGVEGRVGGAVAPIDVYGPRAIGARV